jgi:phosphoglucosamine mutase
VAEIQKTGLSLHDLKSGMHKYPQVLINVRTKQKVDLNHSGIQNAVKAVENSLGANGRVLLRASGTEPLIRVMVEGHDFSSVENFAKQLAEDVKQAIVA